MGEWFWFKVRGIGFCRDGDLRAGSFKNMKKLVCFKL